MMGVMSNRSDRKQETHDRIVQAAARSIRERGFDGTGVADLMAQVGLTHGGFYAHFSSKADLLTQALASAGEQALDELQQRGCDAAGVVSLDGLLAAYLSTQHLQAVGMGCPMAALATETVRQGAEVRGALTQRLLKLVDTVQLAKPNAQSGRAADQALAVTSAMIGAMVLARAVDHPELSQRLLKSTQSLLSHVIESS
jgi:AcrR family transcriptional regulator